MICRVYGSQNHLGVFTVTTESHVCESSSDYFFCLCLSLYWWHALGVSWKYRERKNSRECSSFFTELRRQILELKSWGQKSSMDRDYEKCPRGRREPYTWDEWGELLCAFQVGTVGVHFVPSPQSPVLFLQYPEGKAQTQQDLSRTTVLATHPIQTHALSKW